MCHSPLFPKDLRKVTPRHLGIHMLYLMYTVQLLHFRDKDVFLKFYSNFSLHSDTEGQLFLLFLLMVTTPF